MPYTEEEINKIFGYPFRNMKYTSKLTRLKCQQLLQSFNNCKPENYQLREKIYHQLFKIFGKDSRIEIPFYCDSGKKISIGERTVLNTDCCILDGDEVIIGNDCWIGPKVQIYATSHPISAIERKSKVIVAPITIGNDVWIGGGVIICPGIKIGDRSVIGAGSIVTKDIPNDVLAFGNPCKIQKKINIE